MLIIITIFVALYLGFIYFVGIHRFDTYFDYAIHIVKYVSPAILFLGTYTLIKFERYTVIKWTAFTVFVAWFLKPIIFFLEDDLHILIPGSFGVLFVYLSLAIPVAFIIVGISNRQKYGNYLVSSGIISFFSFNLVILFNILFIDIMSYPPYASSVIFSYTFLMIVLSSTFLTHFAIRIRNKYIIAYAIIIFIIGIYDFYKLSEQFLQEIHYVWKIIILIFTSVFIIAILIAIRFFELGKRFRKGVRVFISYTVDDFNTYRVEDIAQFLESQKGISRVFYCETDLSGNIDEWMQKMVPRCQILIFVSTEDSIKSRDCLTELNLAKSNEIQIVPVLGVGLVWDDLEQLDIHREYGAQFEPMNFENFCSTIYTRIRKYKKAAERELPKK